MLLGNAEQRTPLVAAVAGLSMEQQDFVHAGAGLALGLAVQLDEGYAALHRQLRTQRGLAGAAQANQRNALLTALRTAQAVGGSNQRIDLVELRIVEPHQQALHPCQRRARRILQQFDQRQVQCAGCRFQGIDGYITFAGFHIRQKALAQARIGRQLLACHAPARAPGPHALAQLGQGPTGLRFG